MIFSKLSKDSVSALGESQLIEQIRLWFGPVSPPAPYGIGDDCALLPSHGKNSSLLTTDSLCFGRHFNQETPPEKAGAKLIKRNLSDIAAMGGIPLRYSHCSSDQIFLPLGWKAFLQVSATHA